MLNFTFGFPFILPPHANVVPGMVSIPDGGIQILLQLKDTVIKNIKLKNKN